MVTIIVTVCIGIAIASALFVLYRLMTGLPRTSKQWQHRYDNLTKRINKALERKEQLISQINEQGYQRGYPDGITEMSRLIDELSYLYEEQDYAARMVKILQEREKDNAHH